MEAKERVENQFQVSRAIQASVISKPFNELTDVLQFSTAAMVCRYVGFGEAFLGRWWDNEYPKVEDPLKEIVKVPAKEKMKSILLAGGVGTGKTSYMAALTKQLFLNYARHLSDCRACDLMAEFMRAVRFVEYGDLSAMIREELREDGGGDIFRSRDFESVRLLIIDDLLDGLQKEYDLIRLGTLINARYSNLLPTWITTNYSAERLEGWEGFERCYSRLADRSWCRYFQLTGPDRRRK